MPTGQPWWDPPPAPSRHLGLSFPGHFGALPPDEGGRSRDGRVSWAFASIALPTRGFPGDPLTASPWSRLRDARGFPAPQVPRPGQLPPSGPQVSGSPLGATCVVRLERQMRSKAAGGSLPPWKSPECVLGASRPGRTEDCPQDTAPRTPRPQAGSFGLPVRFLTRWSLCVSGLGPACPSRCDHAVSLPLQ